MDMPRGVNHRVIEVKGPKGEYFERAILFLRDGEDRSDGEIELLSGEYIKYLCSEKKRLNSFPKLRASVLMFLGALLGGVIIYFIK